MGATKAERDARRGARVVRSVGLDPQRVSSDYVKFVGRRRIVRERVTLIAAAPALVVVVLYTRVLFAVPAQPNMSAARHVSLWGGVTATTIGVLLWLGEQAALHFDIRAARSLQCRVSRAEQYGILTVVGRLRLVGACVILGLNLTVLVGLFTASTPSTSAYRWGDLIGVASCVGVAIAGMRRAVLRPAIAIDATSLAVDERLRSGEAFGALCGLIVLGTLAIPVSAQDGVPDWLGLLETFTFPVSMGLWLMTQPRWSQKNRQQVAAPQHARFPY